MALLDQISGALGGFGSLYGALQAENERRRALAAQQASIQQYNLAADTDLQNALTGGSRGLYSAAGVGSDLLHDLGANLGQAMAAGGLYNPSAVGGALAMQGRSNASALSDLAARNVENAQNIRARQLSDVAGLRLGLAGQQYGQANNNVQTATQGLQSFLGSLAQANLARSGANAYRMTQPLQNGTQNQAVNLPGNAPARLPLGSYGQGIGSAGASTAFRGGEAASGAGAGTPATGMTAQAAQARLEMPTSSPTAMAALGRSVPMLPQIAAPKPTLYPYGKSPTGIPSYRGR